MTDLDNTISAFSNFLILTMMTKLMTNHLPHAIGISSNTDYGWKMLNEFLIPHGIYLDYIAKRDLENEYIDIVSLNKYKAFMGCFFLLIKGEAKDDDVDYVYDMIKQCVADVRKQTIKNEKMTIEDLLKELRRIEGLPEYKQITTAPTGRGYISAIERVLWIESKLHDRSRLGKVLAIDEVAHMEHDQGSFISFIIGTDMYNSELNYVTRKAVTLLSR